MLYGIFFRIISAWRDGWSSEKAYLAWQTLRVRQDSTAFDVSASDVAAARRYYFERLRSEGIDRLDPAE
jgi:hypothetical protein